MKLHLENGKTVTISAPNNGDDKRYISSMTLNGKEYTKNYLTHQDLLNGASISFKMDANPNQQRGTKETDFPILSLTNLKRRSNHEETDQIYQRRYCLLYTSLLSQPKAGSSFINPLFINREFEDTLACILFARAKYSRRPFRCV